jgi:hypothetical protein
MKKSRKSSPKLLFQTGPFSGQDYAREALEITNKLPGTTVEASIQKGIEEGSLSPVGNGTFKLVGNRGLEREWEYP